MKGNGIATRLYGVAGLVSLAGVGMVFSVVFAGPGILLLVVGALLFLGGLIRDLVRAAAAERGTARERTPAEALRAEK